MNSDRSLAGDSEHKEASGEKIRTKIKWRRVSSSEKKVFKDIGATLSVLSAVVALVQIFVRDGTTALILSIASMIVVPSVYVAARRTIRRKALLPVPVIVGGVIVAALVGVAVGGVIGYRIHVVARSQPGAFSASARESGITLLRPRNGDRVRECPIVEGSGVIPGNKALYIIVVPDITERPNEYWFESPTKMDGPDHWSASEPVNVGLPNTDGVEAKIYAVLLDKQWGDFIMAGTGLIHWSAPPPTDYTKISPVTVTRIAEPSGQSCHSTNG